MNGVRSTYMRKGYLLTALAAAVLLAASPGIASAQSIGFVGTSATVGEGATPDPRTADPITVEIEVSGLTLSGFGENNEDAFGMLTIQHDADLIYPGQELREVLNQRIWLDSTSSALDEAQLLVDNSNIAAHTDPGKTHLYGVGDGTELSYDNNGVIRLVIIDLDGDGNWVDNMFTMRLVTTQVTGDPIPPSPSPASYIVTVADNDPQPTVSFSESSLSLTEGSATAAGYSITVGLEAGRPMDPTDDPMMELLTNNVQFVASPAGAVVFHDGDGSGCTDANDRDVISLDIGDLDAGGITYAAATRTFTVTEPVGMLTEAVSSFDIEACGDKSGFQDGMVTFSFVERSLTGTTDAALGTGGRGIGNVAAGNSLVVTVQSNEAVPTVQFGTSSINIDEGSTETVAILADEETGPEVDSVMVSLAGDAVLSLWQDDTMLEANDYGNYEVDLMDSANAILTVSADSDPALEDGMTSMATLKIESANGADIGDGDTVSVTVNGSTAVPALPLVGQLLLALFLMAGGVAAVSSAPGIAPSSQGVGGRYMRRGAPVRTCRVPPSIYLAAAGFPAASSNASFRRRTTVMNVSRSTFLTVAALLVGFAGTAWAQTTKSFTLSITRSAVLEEGAGDSNSTPDRTKLTITRSDPTFVHSYDGDDDGDTDETVRRSVFFAAFAVPLTATCNGEMVSADNDDCSFSVEATEGTGNNLGGLSTSGSASVSFDVATAMVGGAATIERTIELLVSHDGDDGDWNEETLVLTVGDVNVSGNSVLEENVTYSFDPSRSPTSTLTIRDDDPTPKLKLTPPSIQLAKGNMQTMTVGVGVGGGGRGTLPDDPDNNDDIRGTLAGFHGGAGRDGSSDAILLSVSPPEAVGTLIQIWKDANDDGMLDPAERMEPDGQGRYSIGAIGAGTDTGDAAAGAAVGAAAMDDGIKLMVKAIDVSGFRDEQITFTLIEGRTEAQKVGDGGGIDPSDPATVTILSGEETPTVTFSKESVNIEEGASETVHLLASGMQGSEVGSATVSVRGDALIELRQGNSTTSGSVSFGGSANAELTIVSLSDRELEDGEEKTATVTITDASGASIGDPRAITVTVVGSTAVPVLPLVAQLLLALLLMVGGARLYRRRQG